MVTLSWLICLQKWVRTRPMMLELNPRQAVVEIVRNMRAKSFQRMFKAQAMLSKQSCKRDTGKGYEIKFCC